MADRNGYIGRAPGDSSVTIARQTNTLTGVQTSFVVNAGYDVSYLDVYINGAKLVNAIDFQATDSQNVVLTTPATAGDVVEFVAYKAVNISKVVTESEGLTVTGEGLTVNADTTLTGDFTVNGVGVVTAASDGSALTGIVTSLVAGSHISLSGSTGQVTISGITTADVVTDTLEVKGASQLTGKVTLDNDLDLQDNDKILVGTGDDLEIYHNGTASFIDNKTGVAVIRSDQFQVSTLNGTHVYIDVPTDEQGVELYYDNSKKIETTDTGVSVSGNVSATGNVTGVDATFSGNVSVGGTLTYEDVTNIDSVGVVTARSGIDLAGALKEGANITSGKLSDNPDINISNGMVHLFTTQETTTSTPNIVSNAGINTDLAVGEAISVTIITTAAAGGYSAQLQIDGANVTENWSGGSAPDAGGSSGVDIYTHTIIKTGNAAYTVVSALTKTSA